MSRRAAATAFLRSREGHGWFAILAFAAILSVAVGSAFYNASLGAFVKSKSDEKVTALQLVDAFVNNYSDLRGTLKSAGAPVPASFRAHSIELFNQQRDSVDAMRMRWIGRAGRAIVTPPSDPQMAATIESFVGKPDPTPVSQFVTIGGEQFFRTVYPSIAREQSCVDCHNAVQPGLDWKVNDVMGAFSLDAPVGAFLHRLRFECVGIGVILFLVIGVIGLMVSVSHYRRIAEREEARERAEAASRSKSAFLATMSHELRTPLNAIIGFSDIMLREMLGEFRNEQYRTFTADIRESGTHLLQIINDILDLSKAEAGKLELNEDLFDLRDTIRSIDNLTREQVRGAGLTGTLIVRPDLPLLKGDEVKTKQVLLNLIANAIKFTPEGGSISLTADVDRDGWLAITIADTGIGIAPDHIERVLEAFEQADSSLARQHEGTGLGLPLAKTLMAMHDGTLDLQSTVGTGTQVTVRFPPERLIKNTTAATATGAAAPIRPAA